MTDETATLLVTLISLCTLGMLFLKGAGDASDRKDDK
jgi:hypothetical protein